MKKLFIMRHAKSSWEDFSVSDHDRDLLDVGIKRTGKVVNYLKKKKEIPQLIISSSAKRALKTAKLVATGLGYPDEKISVTGTLYDCNIDDILSELYGLPDEVNSVMIVGHNPAFTDFANWFLSKKHRIYNLPTSGIVALKLKTKHWEKVFDADSKLLFKAFPKEL